MSYNRQPVAEDPMQIWGAVGVLLILLLFVIWLFLPEVVYASCLILHTLWGLVNWGPVHNYAAPRYNLLAMTGNNAANISYNQWINVMEQTIGILWMYLLPVTPWCLWEWYQHPGQSRFTRRPVDITQLPHIFASLSPVIAPEAFVEQHILITNMQLDVATARRCFMAQLGKPLTSWKDMAPHEKALFAVFGLQYFLDDRKAALKLMNTLNLSCRIKSKRDNGKFCTPVYSLAKSAFQRVIKSDGAQQWLKQHRYVRSGLVWLYAHDLRFTPPNWLWLKGVDRTLFYALHRANTTKGFIEGAGVVAVARTEVEAMRFGLPCPEPCVDEAVEGLRRDMLSLGLIWDEQQPDRDRKRRILTNWSLTDDVLSRTPATDNEF
ncbi:TPA: IncI1-type conjugal transfer protein TrbA [Salmonella enterica]|nr:conjugal transfer protein TrbA [Salmonella enterica]